MYGRCVYACMYVRAYFVLDPRRIYVYKTRNRSHIIHLKRFAELINTIQSRAVSAGLYDGITRDFYIRIMFSTQNIKYVHMFRMGMLVV